MENIKQRIRYIDALRGFTMILVVWGHVMLNMGLGGYNTILGSIFLTFRMPMFFFISGYIAYKGLERWNLSFYKQMMRKKAFVQIVPALIFFTLFTICYHGSFNVLEKGWGGYWFTFVLFEMFCIYFTMSLICKYTMPLVLDVSMIVFSLLGIAWLVISSRNGALDSFFCTENLAKYLQFFTFGILARKYNKLFLKFISSDYVRTSIIAAFVIFLVISINTVYTISNPFIHSLVHDELVRYAGLITLFIFFFIKKDFFDTSNHITNSLLFIGRRTLDIYLLHYFLIPQMPWLTKYLESSNVILLQFVITGIVSLLVVAVCLLISEIIRSSNALAYFCFGAKTKNVLTKNEENHTCLYGIAVTGVCEEDAA